MLFGCVFYQGIYRGGYEFLSIEDVSDERMGSDYSDYDL
jgi:hypothetical protein